MFGTQTSSAPKSELKSLGQVSHGLVGTPRAVTDIEQSFQGLSACLEMLSNKVANLRVRLEPVMVSVPENPNKDSEAYGGSAISREVEAQTAKVKKIDRDIAFILDSLQI